MNDTVASKVSRSLPSFTLAASLCPIAPAFASQAAGSGDQNADNDVTFPNPIVDWAANGTCE